ncbi:DUF6543 domain-containing protein [Pseudomonas sp. A34-9]|uniref:DUF6543 domain-containing protein n=1 Tax=Pseudomonas sp. A34-9 TaxID=3034675 RepID=UPI00240DCB9D|nr:DUF6543 domain-containing protein [Pseudomonas sp. A34-9]
MTNIYKSLMRGSEGEEFTWLVEWEKAARIQDELFSIINAMPTVRTIARQLLKDEFKRQSKSIDIDKAYINIKDKTYESATRPSGQLVDVLFYCLDQNVLPNYLAGGGDGLFYLPDTFSDQFKVAGCTIFDVEDAITNTLLKIETKLGSEVSRYWAAPAKSSMADQPSLTNRQALQHAVLALLTAELSLGYMAGYFDNRLGARFVSLLNVESGRGAYTVLLNPVPDYLTLLGPGFVLDNAEQNSPEMKLVKDSTGYIMHTPENGFEYFENNIGLDEKLRVRLSLPGSKISYPKAPRNIVSHYVETHLQGQLETVSTLFRVRNNLDQPLSSLLQENQGLHILRRGVSTRFGRLHAALKRTEWPRWLRESSSTVQARYTELEDTKDQYDAEYRKVFDTTFSFKDYVNRTFSRWSMDTLGEDLDPETIEVHTLYTMKVGGRTIEQEDTRSLTEFIVVGLHDAGHNARITIKGTPTGSRLSAEKLEQWLNSRNMRTQFVSDIPPYPSGAFQQAYRDQLYSKIELSLFMVRQSGYFNEGDAKIVERALAGDPSVFIRGVKLRNQPPALKDVLVFTVRENHGYFVFAKVPEGGFELLKFAHVYELNERFEGALASDRSYAASLIHPDYLWAAGRSRYEMDTRHADLFLSAKEPLVDYANVAYRNEVALHATIAPIGYKSLGVEGRKRLARLNTELKALSTVDARENGFPSFEQFTYDEVKKTLERILLARGRKVEVDPDLIFVKADSFRKSITDLLIEGVVFEAGHPAYAQKNDPTYEVIGKHPVIDELDIRDLSSLSKTFRPGDRYTALLEKEYLDKKHPDYEFKRAVHAKKVRCEMHCNALADFVDGRLSYEFFTGVRRVIDSLKEGERHQVVSDSPFEGNEGLFKFNLLNGLTEANSRTVGGVYIFRLLIGSVFHDLLYTPDAPDRLSFRPIQDFIGDIRYRQGAFREYYINRVLLVDNKAVNDYFDRLVATTDTRAPIQTQRRSQLFDLYVFHDVSVRRVLSDIDEKTTSLKEVIRGLIYDNLIKAANIISLVVPPLGTVVTAVELMKSIYDGSQSHRRGDYSAARGHIKEAVVGLFTLGKAAAAGPAAKNLTSVQRSFLSLFKDARTVAQFVAKMAGQTSADEALVDFFKDLMKELPSTLSNTTVR